MVTAGRDVVGEDTLALVVVRNPDVVGAVALTTGTDEEALTTGTDEETDTVTDWPPQPAAVAIANTATHFDIGQRYQPAPKDCPTKTGLTPPFSQ